MGGNPTRHVLIALALTALVYIIGDSAWSGNIASIAPVTTKKRGA